MAWGIFTLMEATDWKFTPDQIAGQDEVLMHNVVEIYTFVQRLRKPRTNA